MRCTTISSTVVGAILFALAAFGFTSSVHAQPTQIETKVVEPHQLSSGNVLTILPFPEDLPIVCDQTGCWVPWPLPRPIDCDPTIDGCPLPYPWSPFVDSKTDAPGDESSLEAWKNLLQNIRRAQETKLKIILD